MLEFDEPWARIVYVALALITIAIGLVVHFLGTPLTPVARDVAGDVVWAAMIAWWIGVLVPRAAVAARGLAAYLVCVTVEVSQAFHTPSLDAIRATTPGHLVLGSGFGPRDLAAYAIGVGAAMLIESMTRRSRRATSSPNVADGT